MKTGDKHVVLISEKVFPKVHHLLSSIKNLRFIVAPVPENELSNLIEQEKPVAVIIGTEKYEGSLYDSLPSGSLIARFGVGCDGIDINKATAKGLVVTNTPHVLDATVAEFTVFLAGEVLRKAGRSHEQMKNGNWAPSMGNDLNGKIWTILGMGNIGERLSKILSAGFGVRVVGYKRNLEKVEELKKQFGAEKIVNNYEEAVRDADIISVHVPANSETYHFLNRESMAIFKPGSILINTGRGALIDEEALYDFLESGHIAAAGLDVFDREPYVPVNPAKDLRKLPNVVMTPHIGTSTAECAERMMERVLQNINYHLEGQRDKMDVVMSN